jgi:hypothetical protein
LQIFATDFMKLHSLIVALFLTLACNVSAVGQPSYQREDLRDKWKVVEDGNWKDYEKRTASVKTIYFTLDPLEYSGSRIVLEGVRPFFVWANGRLLAEAEVAISMDIDSLTAIIQGPLTIGVHSERGISYLKTTVLTPTSQATEVAEELRKSNHLLNFSLLAVFILALYFIMLVRSNPRATLDYFNIARLVSAQERDESLVMGRIMSSFNILVYVFIVLWASLLLLIIAHYAGTLWIVVNEPAIHGLADAFVKWGKIAGLLLVAVAAKMMLVLLLSRIFNMREGASIQLLNFFRLLGALVMILSSVLLFYFVFETIAPGYYINLISLVTWIFVLWAVLIFIKLLNKSTFTLFHLISYLCASEFFPIIIVLRVLFF